MELHRPTVSISKSSPSIIRFPASKSKPSPPNPSVISKKQTAVRARKRLIHSLKRSVVANTEKGAVQQRKPYLIFEKGVNYTPKALNDPSYPSASEKVFAGLPAAKPLAPSRTLEKIDTRSSTSMQSLVSRFSISRRSQSRASIALSIFSAGMMSVGEFSLTQVAPPEEEEEEMLMEDRPPSMFRLREDPPPRSLEIKTTFTINLVETETMFMLVLPSGADSIDSERGKAISEQNALYDKGLQTSKTISQTATQTNRVFRKHRRLYMPRNTRANASAYATVWNIYDTYEEEKRDSIKSILAREEGQVDRIEEDREEENVTDEFEYHGQKFDGRFLNALMVMERLIEKKIFSEKQILYQGKLVQDPLSVDVKCNYTLRLLWTFEYEQTTKRKVSSMCWSADDHNILAVGYGKFKYTDKCDGLVCVWNVKNPQNPEREFHFEDPVTFVTFSVRRPHILAVSFYSGLVLLVDIISRSLLVKASNRYYPLYYPVWQARWLPGDDKGLNHQNLLTCGKNGKVFKYKKTKFFISKKLMSMGRPHGTIQGVEQPRKCYPRKTLSCRHPSAEVLVLHPTDPLMYLVGTSEGVVYYCSVNHRHDHIEVFVAHNGPIYTIQFNPFCSKIFLTCGADWCIRIWAETIFEPLITLESGMTAVQDALWNPLHSTIIVSITGNFIEIWDIRRRTSTPKSSTVSPTNSFNTVLQFTQNKFNLCVGDADGHVHVMALTEMPFSPSFQEEVLAQSIQNMLITRPDTQELLYRLGHPFASEETSFESKLYRKLDNLHKVI